MAPNIIDDEEADIYDVKIGKYVQYFNELMGLNDAKSILARTQKLILILDGYKVPQKYSHYCGNPYRRNKLILIGACPDMFNYPWMKNAPDTTGKVEVDLTEK